MKWTTLSRPLVIANCAIQDKVITASYQTLHINLIVQSYDISLKINISVLEVDTKYNRN